MKFLFISAALVAAGFLYAAGENSLPLKPETVIRCGGLWGGHLQGVCTDGQGNIFWVFSRHLVKTGSRGKVLHATLLKREEGTLYHGGAPVFYKGRIYVPYCGSGFNRRLGGKPSLNFVQVYDSALEYIKSYPIPEVEYGAGAMTEADGRFFITGGRPQDLPGNTIYEYSNEFKLLARHELKLNSYMGIQSLVFDGRYFWIGGYGTRNRTLQTDRNFRIIGRYAMRGDVGLLPLTERLMMTGSTGLRKTADNNSNNSYGTLRVRDIAKLKISPQILEIKADGRLFFNGKALEMYRVMRHLLPLKNQPVELRFPPGLPAEKLAPVIELIQNLTGDITLVGL